MAIDKIGSKALVDCSVAAADIAPGTITGTQLAGSIANAKLANSTVTINGTAIALGASGSIDPIAWQSVVVSDGSTVTTMVAGRGYFVNNTSAAGIVKLPISASAGDTIAIKDYAGNFATNKLTIQRNGHNIQGVANDSEISTNRASVQLVYIDATKGWLYTNESNVADLGQSLYVTATGGTVTTSGDFKIHSFTGDGNFVVSCGGNPGGSTQVDYLVVAGGGGGAAGPSGGGGGGGGFRESHSVPVSGCYTASPLATPTGITVTSTTYPVTVGAGGAGGPAPTNASGARGSNSVFSTITSTGGGGGGQGGTVGPTQPGGSGGGSRYYVSSGGSGNTPPVSPPQGNNGGTGSAPGVTGNYPAGGGGGATEAGVCGPNTGPNPSGRGGAGATTSITGSAVARSGGGGGGYYAPVNAPGPGSPCGTGTPGASSQNASANTGGGAGSAGPGESGSTGGKGVVIIRYKFQ